MTDVHRILEIERLGEFGDVGCVGVHIVARTVWVDRTIIINGDRAGTRVLAVKHASLLRLARDG